jgi:hypothetical protein
MTAMIVTLALLFGTSSAVQLARLWRRMRPAKLIAAGELTAAQRRRLYRKLGLDPDRLVQPRLLMLMRDQDSSRHD